jgi:hypothetical protein
MEHKFHVLYVFSTNLAVLEIAEQMDATRSFPGITLAPGHSRNYEVRNL